MMKMLNVSLVNLLAALLWLSACTSIQNEHGTDEDDQVVHSTDLVDESDANMAKEGQNILNVIESNDSFSSLLTALKSADLTQTLSGETSYTVFAPINEAFKSVPEGQDGGLFKAENKAQLTSVLRYHVVPGDWEAEAILEKIDEHDGTFEMKTVHGGTLTAALEAGEMVLRDAQGNVSTVVMSNIEASNGVIHAVSMLVLPE